MTNEEDLPVTSPRHQSLNQRLKEIPEQKPGYSAWELSQEFCTLIDCLPFYTGIVLEDGESVNLGSMESMGFKPTIPLDTYLKGLVYAKLQGKVADTHVPGPLHFKVRLKIEFLLQQEILPYLPIKRYHCPSYEQLKKREEGND